jgi:hypothetical protein
MGSKREDWCSSLGWACGPGRDSVPVHVDQRGFASLFTRPSPSYVAPSLNGPDPSRSTLLIGPSQDRHNPIATGLGGLLYISRPWLRDPIHFGDASPPARYATVIYLYRPAIMHSLNHPSAPGRLLSNR